LIFSSILDHFLDIRQSNIERFLLKHGLIFLTYTSGHLLYVWILLLQYNADAITCICHCRDKINLNFSSILDHFLDIRQSNIERFLLKHGLIFLTYTSGHLLYAWILHLQYSADASTCICHSRDVTNEGSLEAFLFLLTFLNINLYYGQHFGGVFKTIHR